MYWLFCLCFIVNRLDFDYRMMMLDEEQISFRSDSLMSDNIEDYSHQIAEMIGLRSSSSFIQAGVCYFHCFCIQLMFPFLSANMFTDNYVTRFVYRITNIPLSNAIKRVLP